MVHAANCYIPRQLYRLLLVCKTKGVSVTGDPMVRSFTSEVLRV